MRFTRSAVLILVFALGVTARALAGPPLICHSNPIGMQPSLPWSGGDGWNGAVPSYDLDHLQSDTLALLAPSAPVTVRMETIRRAVIYAARREGLAEQIGVSLLGRALDPNASRLTYAAALFDAGYYVETLRDAARISRMLDGNDRDAWMIHEAPTVDGLALIHEAIAMGGDGMNDAVAIVTRARAERR